MKNKVALLAAALAGRVLQRTVLTTTPTSRPRPRRRRAMRPSPDGRPPRSPSRPPTRWPPTPATRCSSAGGSAVDAAIAVQMVLALVEPQSSGIGGGAFLLHFDGKDVEAYDGRETAPAAADERLFMGADGKPLPFYEAVVGGRAVGVPGAVRMLEMAHRQHGRLPWARLFEPAIALAERGFEVSPRLNTQLRSDAHLKKDPVSGGLFLRTRRRRPGRSASTLRNPELAAVLRRIAAEGSKALHEGEIAQAIVKKVRSHPTNPGRMTLADLAGYQPKKRAALCHDYRARGRDYRMCGFPPPGSGAIAVGQILGILDHTHARSASRWRTACPRPTGCTSTPRRRAWRLPTAPNTSATRISCSRPRATGQACSSPPTWRNARD